MCSYNPNNRHTILITITTSSSSSKSSYLIFTTTYPGASWTSSFDSLISISTQHTPSQTPGFHFYPPHAGSFHTSSSQKQQFPSGRASQKYLHHPGSLSFSYDLYFTCQQNCAGSISHFQSPLSSHHLYYYSPHSSHLYFNSLLPTVSAYVPALLHQHTTTVTLLWYKSDNVSPCSKPSKVLHLTQGRNHCSQWPLRPNSIHVHTHSWEGQCSLHLTLWSPIYSCPSSLQSLHLLCPPPESLAPLILRSFSKWHSQKILP